MYSRKSFTLIELLIVLAIVAILSVVVILTLNPSELLKQSRDSTRLSDLSTLNTSLGLFSGDVTGGFLGTSSVVYVSIPDTTSTCANLGLPTLPTGWSYNCVTATSTKLANGRGWVPVNFTQISFGAPLSSLPVDPVNTTSSGNYYTYVSGGSYQLSSKFESQKYQPQAASTNNYDPGLYVLGTNTNLAPFVGGLVGWWTFDDSNNSTTSDSSGFGNTGTWYGTSTPHYAPGRVGPYAGIFNGSSDYVEMNLGNPSPYFSQAISESAWVNVHSTGSSGYGEFLGASGALISRTNGPTQFAFYLYGIDSPSYLFATGLTLDQWYYVVFTYDSAGGANNRKIYVNGVLTASDTKTGIFAKNFNPTRIGTLQGSPTWSLNGQVDDLRVYNRALSATEVSALYNATK